MKLKICSQKIELPNLSKDWSFDFRPGGLIVASVVKNGVTKKIRFFAHSTGSSLSLNLSGKSFYADVQDEVRGSEDEGSGDSDLVAQFPGKIIKLLVKENQKVSEGDALLVVEAMKMEFTVKAPFDGRVTKILVSEGQQLSPGDRFLDFEGEA